MHLQAIALRFDINNVIERLQRVAAGNDVGTWQGGVNLVVGTVLPVTVERLQQQDGFILVTVSRLWRFTTEFGIHLRFFFKRVGLPLWFRRAAIGVVVQFVPGDFGGNAGALLAVGTVAVERELVGMKGAAIFARIKRLYPRVVDTKTPERAVKPGNRERTETAVELLDF